MTEIKKQKMKICKWLDSNEWGALHFENGIVSACCTRPTPLLTKNIDYSTLTLEELQNARKAFFDGINDGSRSDCDGCGLLIEKDENSIRMDKINALILLPFTTCNLRCNYCYLSHEELGKKLELEKTKILPIIQNLHEIGFLSENFALVLGGGEPTLLKDIDETLQFMENNFQNPYFKLLSNSSIQHKVLEISQKLQKINNVFKVLYTSIDCGNAETFAKMKGQDLFYDVVNNIYKYAISNVFNEIQLKYIILEDESNTSDGNIFGFGNVCKLISDNNLSKTSIVIDADVRNNRISHTPINSQMLNAAGKLYYIVHHLLNLQVEWLGGRLSDRSDVGLKDIERIKEFAASYKDMPKSPKEEYYLNFLTSGLHKINKNTASVELESETPKAPQKNTSKNKITRIIKKLIRG